MKHLSDLTQKELRELAKKLEIDLRSTNTHNPSSSSELTKLISDKLVENEITKFLSKKNK